jgi:REP element-mobilizing transposase RayT
MARFQHPGAIYHAHTTSAGSIPIVLNDGDRKLWRMALAISIDRYGLVVMAWCLMTTHWHLLLETPRGNIADAMRWLNGVYAQGFNRRYERRGHLFGKRYDAWVIQSDRHLLNAASYIAWNPVDVGLAPRPSAYRWGSYAATAGGGYAWPANGSDDLLIRAGGREAYVEFVESRCDASFPHL